MTYTENYNLNLPEGSDNADISKLNENFETIDAELAVPTCAVGSFANTATTALCQTDFGTKPSIFKLYYIADNKRTLAAEFFPQLDTESQLFVYNNIPITSMIANVTGLIRIKFGTNTGMTFIWEAYR